MSVSFLIDRDIADAGDRGLKQSGPLGRGRGVERDVVAVARLLVDHAPDEELVLLVAEHGQRRDGRIGGAGQLGQRADVERQRPLERHVAPTVGRAPRRRLAAADPRDRRS